MWIISGPDKNLMKSEKSSSNEAAVKVQPGRGCLRSVLCLKHVRFLLLCKNKRVSVPEKIPNWLNFPCHYQSGTRWAELTCSRRRTPALLRAEMGEKHTKCRQGTSARKKRKSSLVQKRIYATSDIFCSNHILLKPESRGCCA